MSSRPLPHVFLKEEDGHSPPGKRYHTLMEALYSAAVTASIKQHFFQRIQYLRPPCCQWQRDERITPMAPTEADIAQEIGLAILYDQGMAAIDRFDAVAKAFGTDAYHQQWKAPDSSPLIDLTLEHTASLRVYDAMMGGFTAVLDGIGVGVKGSPVATHSRAHGETEQSDWQANTATLPLGHSTLDTTKEHWLAVDDEAYIVNLGGGELTVSTLTSTMAAGETLATLTPGQHYVAHASATATKPTVNYLVRWSRSYGNQADLATLVAKHNDTVLPFMYGKTFPANRADGPEWSVQAPPGVKASDLVIEGTPTDANATVRDLWFSPFLTITVVSENRRNHKTYRVGVFS